MAVVCNPIRMGRWSELMVVCVSHSDEVMREAELKLHDCIASDCLSVIIETLSDLCSIHVPPKCYKNKYVSRFHRERKILMRKRTKL